MQFERSRVIHPFFPLAPFGVVPKRVLAGSVSNPHSSALHVLLALLFVCQVNSLQSTRCLFLTAGALAYLTYPEPHGALGMLNHWHHSRP